MATYKSGKEYAQKLAARYEELIRTNIPFKETVYNDIARKSKRIFEDGLKSNGSLIGQYSTKPPIYVNPNYAPRKGDIKIKGGGKLEGLLPTIGKPTKDNPEGEMFFTEKTKHRGIVRRKGVVVFTPKAGDPHRCTYLDGGYKELRNRTGRRIDKVNLRFTNDLFLDWANIAIEGAAPKPTKVSISEYVIQLKRDYNIKKLQGHEKKYGTIFASTSEEKKLFLENLNSRIKVFMSK